MLLQPQIGERGREAVLTLDRDTRALDEIANRIAGRIGNQDNSETNALLRELIDATKARQTIEVDGETFGRTVVKSITNISRRSGQSPFSI